MISSKKYKLCFFACLFLFACKSADCGCPMAEQTTIQEQVPKNKKEFQVVLSDDELNHSH